MKSRFRFFCLLIGLLVAFILIYEVAERDLHKYVVTKSAPATDQSIETKITGQISAFALEFLTQRLNEQ